jgi:hypothetical protein
VGACYLDSGGKGEFGGAADDAGLDNGSGFKVNKICSRSRAGKAFAESVVDSV